MATQRCPKCKSKRVRLGYRPTSMLLKILFTYNLLCDECNWEFTGFAIPGTVAKKTKKKKVNVNTENNYDLNKSDENMISEILSDRPVIKEVTENIRENKVNKLKSTNSQVIKKTESKVKDQIVGNIDPDENSLKKHRVRKKVRVKFY